MNKERNKIEMSSDDVWKLVKEGSFDNLILIETNYSFSGRHQEFWEYSAFDKITKIYYKGCYSESTQDTMGWEECNMGSDLSLVQVFPITKIIEVTEYE